MSERCYNIRREGAGYGALSTYLENNLGFIPIFYTPGERERIPSKREIIVSSLKPVCQIYALRKRFRNAEVVVIDGKMEGLFFLLLNKLRISRPKKLVWWGFFFHGAKIQRFLKRVLPLLLSRNVKILLFSEFEKKLYTKNMHLDSNVFITIPYAEWGDEIFNTTPASHRNYYFAGGYSNRDYPALLDAWRQLPESIRLVIIASKGNADLLEYVSSSPLKNVDVLFDQPANVFAEKLRNARACILPFRMNTGASGQQVAMRCIRSGVAVISSDTGVMRAYVKDGVTGILVKDMKLELPRIIMDIENDLSRIDMMADSARKYFEDAYAYEKVTERLKEALFDDV